MTDTGTLERTDTGTHAVVRVIDPGVQVSAPYSRAVGHLDRWVRDERRAVDEFSAWVEGQAAQAAAEIRRAADEQLHEHRQVRVDIAERNRREGTFSLPPGFLEIPPVWAELPEVQELPGAVALANEAYDLVEAYMRADDPDERPGRAAWVNVDGEPSVMPARIVPAGRVTLTPRDNPLAVAYREREARGWTPDPAEYGIPAVEPDHGPIDRWLRRVEDRIAAWWRTKQAQRDKRMGVEQ